MSIERDPKDIWYDLNPQVAPNQCKCGRIKNHPGVICDFCNTVCEYIGDINARYHGEIQAQLQRQRPFVDFTDEYYNLIWDGINNDPTCIKFLEESSFVSNYLEEITNRLCTECEYIMKVEKRPKDYTGITVEDCLPDIIKYFDYVFDVCRYGTGERMIDTVEQDNIDEFKYNLSLLAALRLCIYVQNHQND